MAGNARAASRGEVLRVIIHLNECEPEGKSWMETEFRGLLDQGAEMCPAVEYMRDELYPHETVWIEEKP